MSWEIVLPLVAKSWNRGDQNGVHNGVACTCSEIFYQTASIIAVLREIWVKFECSKAPLHVCNKNISNGQ